MKRISATLLILVAMVLLAGCSVSQAPNSVTDQLVGVWGGGGEKAPYIRFEEAGTVIGNDGCNTFNGSWKESQGTITLGEMAISLIGCMDVDTWLSSATTAKIAGDNLELFNADGKAIGQLPRGSQQNG